MVEKSLEFITGTYIYLHAIRGNYTADNYFVLLCILRIPYFYNIMHPLNALWIMRHEAQHEQLHICEC